MDLKQLEYFVRVAELGSFTRAAAVLAVAQPALSRQVRLLEVELRQPLLLRNGRGVTPTEAGKLLVDHGRGILHQVARAHEDLGKVRDTLSGRVALGLPPTIAKLMTVPLIREFRKRLPDATLSISEGLSVSMREWLLSGRLDIALLYDTGPSAELETAPLREEELFLIGPKLPVRGRGSGAAPIALAAVAGLSLVIPSRPNAIRMLVEARMAGIGCKPAIALEIDGVAAILDLVSDGAGHAVLPRYAVSISPRPEAFVARPIVKPRLFSKLEIATSSRRATTRTQQAMMKLIRDVAATLFAHEGTKTGR
ncbi:MAG: LysR substrate-binding domain-containing protein [Betaproteobacteria bacterium]